MNENNEKGKGQLPEWTKSKFVPEINFVGINLKSLDKAQMQKLVKLMEEIEYEPIQFLHESATAD